MNADITRLQNAFAIMDADLKKAEDSVGPITAKVNSAIDPTVVAALASQAEGFNVRAGSLGDSLTALATGTATDVSGGA